VAQPCQGLCVLLGMELCWCVLVSKKACKHGILPYSVFGAALLGVAPCMHGLGAHGSAVWWPGGGVDDQPGRDPVRAPDCAAAAANMQPSEYSQGGARHPLHLVFLVDAWAVGMWWCFAVLCLGCGSPWPLMPLPWGRAVLALCLLSPL
jgi:hypothetical protein